LPQMVQPNARMLQPCDVALRSQFAAAFPKDVQTGRRLASPPGAGRAAAGWPSCARAAGLPLAANWQVWNLEPHAARAVWAAPGGLAWHQLT
ncbi:MAG: hypothetical protein ACRCUE_01125, partial [Bosea sp. (in: a-proteobacteria)]